MQWSRNMAHSHFTLCLRAHDYIKKAFPAPIVRPLDDSQGSTPLQGHGFWLLCESGRYLDVMYTIDVRSWFLFSIIVNHIATHFWGSWTTSAYKHLLKDAMINFWPWPLATTIIMFFLGHLTLALGEHNRHSWVWGVSKKLRSLLTFVELSYEHTTIIIVIPQPIPDVTMTPMANQWQPWWILRLNVSSCLL